MRGIATSMMVTAYLGLAACSGGEDGSGASESMSTTMAETTGTSASATESESATGSESETATGTDTDPVTGGGLPEGVSNWTGQGEVAGQTFAIEATFTNTGGDLTATVTIKQELIGTGVYSLSGTHEPTAGRVALAPNTWIMEPDIVIELVGLEGVYDPAAKTLSGMLVDYAKGTENYLEGGPVTLTLVDGPGAATKPGDEAKSLVTGSQTFTGTLQCTGAVRETTGELIYDGAGGLTGTLTIGDPGLDAPVGTFTITGVHNPSTGGITLVPGLWIDDQGAVLAFYIDGTYDPGTGSFNGDQWTNTAACPTGTWKTTIQ